MKKRLPIIFLTGASLLCTLPYLSMLQQTDQNWHPMEREFLVAVSVLLLFATLILWARVRWVLPFEFASLLVFGVYQAWLIVGTIRNENYSGIGSLVLLMVMGACPFLAAIAVAILGREFCEKPRAA